MPEHAEILGFRADAVIRVGLAVLATGLSAGAILAFGLGRRNTGTMLALTGGVLSVGMAAGHALEAEADREHTRRLRAAELGALRGFR